MHRALTAGMLRHSWSASPGEEESEPHPKVRRYQRELFGTQRFPFYGTVMLSILHNPVYQLPDQCFAVF